MPVAGVDYPATFRQLTRWFPDDAACVEVDRDQPHRPPGLVALPGVHRVASLLKRWLTGTLHYGYSINQLDYYLDEFTFRFNRRTARGRGLLFYRLLQQALATDPHPYQDLTISGGIDSYLWTCRRRPPD
jgi:hypothetical protein